VRVIVRDVLKFKNLQQRLKGYKSKIHFFILCSFNLQWGWWYGSHV